MGIWDWLRRWLLGTRTRDVSRLGSIPENEVDRVVETVAATGGPLKEKHRRLALRDPRLLPKPPRLRLPLSRRPKFMTAEEANRLFAPTLRTRDRRIRDLLPDAEQLRRYGLPHWASEAELAAALEVDLPTLRFFSVHRERERAPHYVAFALPKRGGGERIVLAPKRRLKALQRKLVRLLLDRLPVSPHAHGFLKGRSVKSGAAPHVGRRVLLHLDVKDCFPSLHFGRVRGLLVALGYGYPVATVLAVLMTEAERQPVEWEGAICHVPVTSRYAVAGAPTSPGLCNALCLRLDRRLAGLARAHGFTYTRYADDLTFSGDRPERVERIRRTAERILAEEGFAANPAKTRVMRRGGRQRVTGVTVNERLGLSREERRVLRAEIHQHVRERAAGRPDAARERRLRGRLAWVRMLNAEQAAGLARKLGGEAGDTRSESSENSH